MSPRWKSLAIMVVALVWAGGPIDVAQAQLPLSEVESEILVRLDTSSLDVFLLNEPYRSAFEAASTAELSLRFRAFGWQNETISSDGSFADYWSYADRTMHYELRVGSLVVRGSNSRSYEASATWSHVIFGSFPSAPLSTAYRVAIGDAQLQVQIRAEELPGATAIYDRDWLPRQRFPAYNEDFLSGFVDRLVVEIRGAGTALLFTGAAFSHADPVRSVQVTPARPVAVEAASWGRLKSLY